MLLDLLYAIRSLRKSPGFLLLAVLSLTMAMAANVVVFGVLDALVLRPLPVPEARSVYTIQGDGAGDLNVSYPDYRDIRSRAHAFRDVALARIAQFGLASGGRAQPLWGYEASGNYFDTLGIQPVLGRFFHSADEHGPNSAPYAVLSYSGWTRFFHADPGVIGSTIQLNRHPFTVIGVAPAGFFGTERMMMPDLWVPAVDQQQIEGSDSLEQRGNHNSWAVARLRPGVTRKAANAELANLAHQLRAEYPATDHGLTLRLAPAGFLGDLFGGPLRAFLGGILLLAALVLVAACANLGGLLAARTSDRARELGIRIAIGSSRSRLVRALLIESLLTSMVSAALASLTASALLEALSRYRLPLGVPVRIAVQPGALSYGFALGIAIATGVLLGLLPLRQVLRADPNQAIKAASGTMAVGRRFAMRDLLLAVQVALCCVLVTASVVAFRGLHRALTMPLAISPGGVTVAQYDFSLSGNAAAATEIEQRKILDAAEQLPGVKAASYGSSMPLNYDSSTTAIYPPGTRDFRAVHSRFGAVYADISPGFLRTAGIPLRAGRDFTWQDDAKSPAVAIVNQTFGRKLFGTDQAVGRRFVSSAKREFEIVGVVQDGKYETLTEEAGAAVWFPILQDPNTTTALLVRSTADEATMESAIQKVIASVDPGLPITHIGSWRSNLESWVLLPARVAAIALSVLGSLAIMLALTGVFGLASYTVSRRLRELGIRIALGASGRQVLRAALSRTLWLLGTGSAAGLALGLAASRVLSSVVYQAQTADWLVITAVVLVMSLVGTLAVLWPARRALSIEPASLLRSE